MNRGIYFFILGTMLATTAANAVSVRGVSTANRNGVATAQNQTVNPTSSYTYNYMYPYLNNQMRTTLKPYDATSPSTNPINTVVRTEQLSAPRRVVPRPTTTTNSAQASNTTRAAINTGMAAGRRVVQRPRTNNTTTQNGVQNQNVARNTATRNQHTTDTLISTTPLVSSARCLADYTECMNRYCEQTDTAYNRCYCSAKLAQIDAEYQPKIDSLIKQIIAMQYGNNEIDNNELREYWSATVSQYTGTNSWSNLDDALNIDWASMDSRVRGQNAFLTGHEYCVQHISGCFYMASNLRDAYRSTIAQDCANYQDGLERLKNVAETVIKGYQE
ncbi:MAG: hypothetical protein J6W79_03180 [Alphaproteobacteria bacterium]|nr:hypothetical protein [Alphaproteobacteria bacterium]